MVLSGKTEAMRKIRDEVVMLTASPLCAYRIEAGNMPVIGEGSHDAQIMFVGEAPGKNEAKTGRPFCGAAGKILDKLLASANIPREEVYITNIVKDRPPQNRDPLPEEITLYAPFLDKQIAIIEPKVIAPLGRYAMNYIMTRLGLELSLEPISVAHGKEYTAHVEHGDVVIIPLYHPAVAIYNNSQYPVLEEDFKQLTKYYGV